MVTMNDVAKKAGVSRQTVSHTLNGRTEGVYISEETRRRVMEVAEAMNYRPNGSALAIKRGRFGGAALLTSNLPHHSYTPQFLLDGVHDELSLNNFHLMLARLSDEQLTDDNFVPKILREMMVDGLLIDYIQHIPPRLIDLVRRHQLPAVWINSPQAEDCVRPDDLDAGYRATRHLLSLGHRRILFADYTHTGNFELEHYSARDRWLGYSRAMSEAGLEPRAMRSKDDGVAAADWVAYSRGWLTAADRPTAVLAYQQEVSPVLIAAATLGWQVPADLSIVAFGSADLNVAGLPITTLTVPEYEVGSAAVQMLLQKIEVPEAVFPAKSFPFGFSAGATCAPAKPDN